MERSIFEGAMTHAIELAEKAASLGDVPVGAEALDASGNEICSAYNRKEELGDPTAHAEMLLIRDCAEKLGTWRLEGMTVVVTLEPCLMCAGALVAARVGRLVFGAPDPKAGACGTLYNVCADPRLNHEIPIHSGIAAERCSAILSDFFNRRRNR